MGFEPVTSANTADRSVFVVLEVASMSSSDSAFPPIYAQIGIILCPERSKPITATLDHTLHEPVVGIQLPFLY